MKFCKKCQAETERQASGNCKPCANAASAAYRAANPEKTKALNAAWKAANPERYKATSAAWYAANHEKSKASAAAWNKTNPERYKANIANWCAANPERHKATQAAYRVANRERRRSITAAWDKANRERRNITTAAWKASNPEARRIQDHNRRARKLENGGVLSRGLAKQLFKLQKGKCPCCGQPLGIDFHLDHKMPLSLGGANADGNMQLLRKTCNLNKSAKHPIDFMQTRGFLL